MMTSKLFHKTACQFVVLVSFCLLEHQVPLHAQTSDEARKARVVEKSRVLDKVIKEEVVLPTLVRPLDESILALAAASKTNFFCDVTEIPATTAVNSFPGTPLTIDRVAVEPGKWPSNLWLQLSDMMEQSGMSHLQLAPRTFLMWHSPEPLQLSREIVGDWQRIQNSFTLPPLDYKNLSSAWKNYFMGLGWDGKSMDVDIQVNFSELPVEAQQRVLLETWQHLFWDQEWNCYDDRLWAQSAVQVGETVTIDKDKVEPYLSVLAIQEENYETFEGGVHGFSSASIPVGPVSATQNEVGGATGISADLLTPIPEASDPSQVGVRVEEPLEEEPMRADAALAHTVSLEMKRASLQDLLAKLSQQSGVDLTALVFAQDSLNSRQFTVKTHDLTLSETMIALSHLTGAIWTKQGQSYFLHGTNEDALSFHLRQVGDPALYRLRERTAAKVKERFRRAPGLIQEVLKTCDLKALQSDYGVPIRQLAPKTQNQLRRYAQEEVAHHLIMKALMERDFLGPRGDGHFENEPEKELVLTLRQEKQGLRIYWYPKKSSIAYPQNSLGTGQGHDLTLTLRRPDGELICSEFPRIHWIDAPATAH